MGQIPTPTYNPWGSTNSPVRKRESSFWDDTKNLFSKGVKWLRTPAEHGPVDYEEIHDMKSTPLPDVYEPVVDPHAGWRTKKPYGGDDDDPEANKIPFLGKGVVTEKKKTPPRKSKNSDYDTNTMPTINAMDNALRAWRSRKGKFDLSPLLALTDSLTGSDILRGYEQPDNADERMAMDMQLQMKLEEHKRKIEHDKQWLKVSEEQLKLKRQAAIKREANEDFLAAMGGGAAAKAMQKIRKSQNDMMQSEIKNPRNKYMISNIAQTRMKAEKKGDNPLTRKRVQAFYENQVIDQLYPLAQKRDQQTGTYGGFTEILKDWNQDGWAYGPPNPQGQ